VENKYCNILDGKVVMIKSDCERKIYLELTSKCNMHCIHCFNNSGESNDELSYQDVERIYKKIIDKKINVGEIILSGGEIYTYSRINDVIKLFSQKYPVKVLTNGTALSQEDIITIIKNKVKIQITLNGPNEEVDSRIRGGGFSKTISTIVKIIKNCGRDLLIVTTTINKSNMDYLEEIIKKCIELGVKVIQFTFVYDEGRAVTNWSDLELTIINKIKIIENLGIWAEKYRDSISVKTSGMRQFIQYIEPIKCEFSCDELTEEITIKINGKSSMCPKIEQYIKCRGIEEQKWEDNLEKDNIFEYSVFESCQKCENNRSCLVSCMKSV